MAETKIWPIFRWANGGLSDDLFTGIRNSFYYSNKLEIREEANCVYPMQTSRDVIETFELWDYSSVQKVVAARYFNNKWYIFSSRAVFVLNEWEWTATKIADWFYSAWELIKDAELFDWNIYISTNEYLYYISQTAATTDWSSSSNFTRIELNTCEYHPLYATDKIMAVWNDNAVWKVVKWIPDRLQDWIWLQADYTVKFINELWWFLRIVSEDWYYWAEILLWDKISDAATEIIPMNWYKFIQSRVYNWYHYLLSDKWLWLMNWYQFYILKKIWEVYSYDEIPNWMMVYDDKLYFVKSDWIYIYWAKNKNYPDVLNLWTSRTDVYWNPWAIATDWKSIIYTESNRISWTRKVYVYLWNKWDKKWTTWELQTMAYYGSSLSEIKQSSYLRVWYLLANWWWIHVYYRTEADATTDNPEDWQRHPVQENDVWLSKNSDMRSPFATTLKLNCRFQWIQFKFVLTQSISEDRPKTRLYSADLYYNDMLD